jgi:hypothetical protein
MGIAAASLMIRVDPREGPLSNLVESVARVTDRPERPLHMQALLQLPRVADTRGVVSGALVTSLLTNLAQELPERAAWFVRDGGSSPSSFRFHEIDGARAYDVLKRFHYLRSPRIDGRTYGLSTGAGNLVALCVSSPLDVGTLRQLLTERGRSAEFARVVSRVFAFEGAPKNTISYMLSRTAREERHFGATDFVTYVNPNMGFTGTSYRASNWEFLGTEPGTKYRYLDGRYITERELEARFGRLNDGEYGSRLGARFAVSSMALEPLLVFHATLTKDGR